MELDRRTMIGAALAALAVGPARAAAPVGVVLLHGKGGSPQASPTSDLAAKLKAAGIPFVAPEMPWSAGRYLSGTCESAVAEVGAAVAQVKAKADRVVLVGHSMGCSVALAYAAKNKDLAGLVLASPGHNPTGYYKLTPQIHESVDRARAMVTDGKGAQKATFYDNNQGKVFKVEATADTYLSYFDPAGACEMRVSSGQISVPVLWVAGNDDKVNQWGAEIAKRATQADKSAIVNVKANHMTAPVVASADIVKWIAAR